MATTQKKMEKQPEFLGEMLKTLVQAMQELNFTDAARSKAVYRSQEIREEFKAIFKKYM